MEPKAIRPAMTLLAAFLILTLAGVLTGCDDYEVHAQNVATYCHMVGLNREDAALGIPPMQRRGWPEDPSKPYDALCLTEEQRLDNDLMAHRAQRSDP